MGSRDGATRTDWAERVFGALQKHDLPAAQEAHEDWKTHQGEDDPQYWVAGTNVWVALSTSATVSALPLPKGSYQATIGKGGYIEVVSKDGEVVGRIPDRAPLLDVTKLRRAIGLLDEGIERNPQQLDLYVARARLYRTLGDLDGELAALTSLALDPHPSAAGVHLERRTKEPYVGTLESYAVGLLSNYATEHYHLPTPADNDAGTAVASLLVKLFPERFEGYRELGWAAVYRRDYAEAHKQFLQATKLAPSNSLVLSSLAFAAKRIGDKAGAIAAYKRVLALDNEAEEVKAAKVYLTELETELE
jgi:Flp pilus assembly protein TadD